LNIQKLLLSNFKNYDNCSLDFHTKFNALVGLNGVGKTNILDAIYYLCLGKSYFTSSDKLVTKDNSDFFRIRGEFMTDDTLESVVIKFFNLSKKEIEVSGVKLSKIADLVGQHLCVIVAPIDITLLLDASEDRRNFLNNTIVQYDKEYLLALMTYNKLLKQRNTFLKDALLHKKFDSIYLDALTTQMIKPAMLISSKRLDLIQSFQNLFSDIYGEISGNREVCQIAYQSHCTGGQLNEMWKSSLHIDQVTGRTSKGIHKDDIQFVMNGQPLKNWGSQGQLKSFVLALKLTQYKILEKISGIKPILLLDDIFDKLDFQRVGFLMNLLAKDYYGQVFITDTEVSRIPGILNEMNLGYTAYHIYNGQIEKIVKE